MLEALLKENFVPCFGKEWVMVSMRSYLNKMEYGHILSIPHWTSETVISTIK
jgi:hypothetical protein